MKPNLQIGLQDLFSYFMPGALLITFGAYYKPELIQAIYIQAGSKEILLVFILILISYITGFFMTQFSSSIQKVHQFIERKLKIKLYYTRSAYYPNLQRKMRALLDSDISRIDEYAFCLRLVAEKCPASYTDISRFYVYTILARNLVMTFLLMSAYLVFVNDMLILFVTLFFAIASFSRYLTYQKIHTNLIYRTAYLYLVLKDQDNIPNDVDSE